jgi:hypothetical protein
MPGINGNGNWTILGYSWFQLILAPTPDVNKTGVRSNDAWSLEPAGIILENEEMKNMLYLCFRMRARLYNEEPARMMTQKTALRSIRPKDVITSLFSLLTLHRGKIWQGFGKRKQCLHRHTACGTFIGKTDEISRTVLFWDKN